MISSISALVNLEHIQMMKRAILGIRACLLGIVSQLHKPYFMGGGKSFSNNALKLKRFSEKESKSFDKTHF